jgi:uncharacterized protein YerC
MPARKIDLDELQTLHGQGWHRDDLAAHFGVAPANITKARRALGLPLDAPRRSPHAGRRRKIDLEEFRQLLGDGWTASQLANHFESSTATITRYRRLAGAPSHLLSPERIARIDAMIEDGWSFAEISRTEGVHVETLRRRYPGRAWTMRQRDAYVSTVRYFTEQINKAPYAIPSTVTYNFNRRTGRGREDAA